MQPKLPIGVFHPGTQHSWQTARALQEGQELAWYATSIFWVKDRFPYSMVPWLPSSLRRRAEAELIRFFHPSLDPSSVHTFAGPEWGMRLARRLGYRSYAKRLQRQSASTFAGPVEKLMERLPVRAVWGYDQTSLEVFQEAKRRGITTILDRTIGHPAVYNRLMDEVYAKYPEFFLSPEYRISQEQIDRADAEHELADHILVGSQFCAETLVDPNVRVVDATKIRVLPYCFDDTFFKALPTRDRQQTSPVRFLFTGQAGPRKGIHLVLKVFDKIPRSAATLTILGDLQVPPETFRRYSDRVEIHRTVARPDVARFMANADYLLLPSYFEGAALVVYEALAAGLGIIQSKNTDVMLAADSPFLLQRLDEDELFRCVMNAIERPRAAPDFNSSDFNFDVYRRRVIEVVQKL